MMLNTPSPEPREEDLPELRFSKETHVVPKSIQNYMANRAKELLPSKKQRKVLLVNKQKVLEF